MNRFINLLRKKGRFSFIRVKTDKPFGCQLMYCNEIRIKENMELT